MIEQWPAYASGGVIALMILKEVFNFVKSRRNGSGDLLTMKEELYRQGRVNDEVREVHLGAASRDKYSEPRWYEDTRLASEKHSEITTLLTRIITVGEETRDAIKANGDKK